MLHSATDLFVPLSQDNQFYCRLPSVRLGACSAEFLSICSFGFHGAPDCEALILVACILSVG